MNMEKQLNNSTLIYQTSLLGGVIDSNTKGFVFSVYENGKVEKKFILK